MQSDSSVPIYELLDYSQSLPSRYTHYIDWSQGNEEEVGLGISALEYSASWLTAGSYTTLWPEKGMSVYSLACPDPLMLICK